MNPPIVFVITIQNLAESRKAAQRCIDSAGEFGYHATEWTATTPADKPLEILKARGWRTSTFTENRYSRPEPAAACFLSHASLWNYCQKTRQTIIIAEHDCVFTRPFPTELLGQSNPWACNLAKPSYGRWKQPTCGLSSMQHKPVPHYMGGATCYLVRPPAAHEFLRQATAAEPTDVYLNLMRFPFLRDFFPWLAEARPEISTVQREAGCAAKSDTVRIV